jgi:hypothetical protein
VRRLIPSVALVLLAASCQAASGPAGGAQPPPAIDIAVRPTPFVQVTEGPVHAIIPNHWAEAPIAAEGSLREGLMASPNLERWRNLDGSVPGIEAEWVDLTRVGIPSDYFYVAAKWPVLPRLAASPTCQSSYENVIVDHGTTFSRLHERFGDFAARASGTCSHHGQVNRWAYFIAAPSYGPVRRIGLPNSGLYRVVAVMRDGPHALRKLHKVLFGARFGGATVGDLMLAARESAQLT